MDCSPPGSSVRGILQARILEWVAISFSKLLSLVLLSFITLLLELSPITHDHLQSVVDISYLRSPSIMPSDPITSWQIDGETVETVRDFIWGASKSLQMVTAAMKLKDACSLKEKQ